MRRLSSPVLREMIEHRHNNPIASEFFFLFARYEYALKTSGRFNRRRQNAEADWSFFATELDSLFDKNSSKELRSAVDYFLAHPPKKQIIAVNNLQWDNTPPNAKSELDLLFAYIRRVRNNLFHGGKFKGRFFADPERSEDLIQHGTTILNHCLSLAPDVKEAMEN